MSDGLGLFGAGMAAVDIATSDGKVEGWVGSVSDPDQRIDITISYDRNSLETHFASQVADAIMTLPESNTFKGLVSAHGPGKIDITISSSITADTGTLGFGNQHVVVIAVRDIGTQYLSTDYEPATFSIQHAVAHELVLPSCSPGLSKLCRRHDYPEPHVAPEGLPLPS